MDCSLPGSSVHGILQARIQKWVAISYSMGSSNPGIEPASLMSPVLAGTLALALSGKPSLMWAFFFPWWICLKVYQFYLFTVPALGFIYLFYLFFSSFLLFSFLIFMISSLLLTLDLLVLIFLVTSDVMLGCLFEICLASWSKCVSLQELLLLQPIDFGFFVCLFSFFCRYFLHFFYDLFIDPLVVQQHIV